MDDDALLEVAKEKLARFDRVEIKPTRLRQLLTRFVELAEEATERRPAHRPRSDRSGQMVEERIKGGERQPDARRRVARLLKKPLEVVRRAHNRWRKRERDRDKSSG